MVIAAEERPAEGVDVLELRPLDRAAAHGLLDQNYGTRLASAVASQVVDAAAGNPLALLEIPASLTTAQRSGAEPAAPVLAVCRRQRRLLMTSGQLSEDEARDAHARALRRSRARGPLPISRRSARSPSVARAELTSVSNRVRRGPQMGTAHLVAQPVGCSEQAGGLLRAIRARREPGGRLERVREGVVHVERPRTPLNATVEELASLVGASPSEVQLGEVRRRVRGRDLVVHVAGEEYARSTRSSCVKSPRPDVEPSERSRA